MPARLTVGVFLLMCGVGLAAPQSTGVTEQQADAFTKKLAMVTLRGVSGARAQERAPQRTPFTEAELNSWFAYRSQELLPTGVTEPRVTILGNGKLKGAATVDLALTDRLEHANADGVGHGSAQRATTARPSSTAAGRNASAVIIFNGSRSDSRRAGSCRAPARSCRSGTPPPAHWRVR